MIRRMVSDAATPRPTDVSAILEPLAAADEARNRSRVGVGSWALYDLANTIFSFNIVSYFMPLWVLAIYARLGRTEGEANLVLGIAIGISMLLNALVSPVMGAVSDQAGVRKPFLLFFTSLCILPTALLGVVGDPVGFDLLGVYFWLGLAVFALANFGYQAALIYYDAMLPEVSSAENRGRVSGIGVGLGYVGTIVGALTVRMLAFQDGKPTVMVFALTAVMFAILALPVFLVVRERRGRTARALTEIDLRASWAQLARTARHASEFPGLLRFLVARLLYTDPINTVIQFMAVFATAAVGYSAADAQTVLIIVTVVAVIMSFAWGFVVDRIGPKRTLSLVLGLWCVSLVLAALTLDRTIFLLVGALAGAALGGTWVSDRVFMLRLSPPAMVGEFFGLYGLAGKFSAVTGPVIWGVTLFTLEPSLGRDAYRIAVAAQLILMVAGLLVLQGVADRPRAISAGEDTAPG
jgi:UMF1 family MFS transporter